MWKFPHFGKGRINKMVGLGWFNPGHKEDGVNPQVIQQMG